jgi:hypothetical protein
MKYSWETPNVVPAGLFPHSPEEIRKRIIEELAPFTGSFVRKMKQATAERDTKES